MSHSPLAESEFQQKTQSVLTYRDQLRKLDDMINRGGSLSGHERNCAFLNVGPQSNGAATHHGHFANISAISGFDFADDGRCVALTDWDADGDLDAWLMNRTGPRVRYLENQSNTSKHAILIRLMGRYSNRDAVGARVILQASPNSSRSGLPSTHTSRKLVRTVRAGEGFLSQSTKTLHFGTHEAEGVFSGTILWPSGRTQQLEGLRTGHLYEIVESDSPAAGIAKAIELHHKATRTVERKPTRDRTSDSITSDKAAILLTSRLPVPELPYTSAAGETVSVNHPAHAGPTLINLWATWCIPCRTELVDLHRHADRLAQHKLKIIALATDDLTTDDADSVQAAMRAIQQPLADRLEFGTASAATLHRLQFLDDTLFSQIRPLAVPTSFLLNEDGTLAAIYRGPIDIATLQQHLDRRTLTGKELYDAALPFSGWWYRPHSSSPPLTLAIEMFQRREWLDTANYLKRNSNQFASQPNYVSLCAKLASSLGQAKHDAEAIAMYRLALVQDADNIAVLNNLAWKLAGANDKLLAAEAVELARRAAKLTNHRSVTVLDTLATAQLAHGDRLAALLTLQTALRIANSAEKAAVTERIRQLQADPD
ncbi:MAG: ASPIC/UnbV domain-containing protein [Pirellulaceae bacterium]